MALFLFERLLGAYPAAAYGPAVILFIDKKMLRHYI